MKKLKVLIVLYALGCGGGEKALLNMLNSFSPDKYDISLQLIRNYRCDVDNLPPYVHFKTPIFMDRQPDKKEMLVALIKKRAWAELFKNLFYYIKSRKANSRERTFYEWKALNCFYPQNTDEYDVAIAAMHGVSTYYVFDKVKAKRKICWIHTDYSKIPEVKAERNYFKQAYKIITVSEKCYDVMKNMYPELDNIEMLYNLNCPKLMLQRAEQLNRLQCFPDHAQWHFVSIGRLSPEKGFDLLLKASCILKKRNLSFHWYVLGEGQERNTLEQLSEELKVQDAVSFIGLQKNPYPYMKWADIIVQTSRYEGKSMVLDEAKILNKPILSTDYDSVNDQIQDGSNGMLVPISAEGIAEGILKLVSEPEIMEHFTAQLSGEDKNQADLIEKYYALIEGRL